MQLTRRLICVCAIVIGMAACLYAQRGIDVKRLELTSELHREVNRILDEWRRDVVSRDVDRLVSWTWEEYRDAVRQQLMKPNGKIYHALYGGTDPLLDLLKAVRHDGAIAFRHFINADGTYVVGCYTTRPGLLSQRTTYAQVMQASDGITSFCLNMVKEEDTGRWYIAYTFAGDL